MSEKKAKAAKSPTSAVKIASVKPAGADTRGDILDAALKVFARHSFEGASLQEMAQRAGVGQPLIHYYFGSKELLWQATIDYAFQDLGKVFKSISAAAVDLDPLDRMKVLVRAFVQYCAQHPHHANIIVNEMRVPGKRLEWIMEKYLQPIHSYSDELYMRAVERGQLKAIPAVHVVNVLIVSIVHFFTIRPILIGLYGVDPRDETIITDHANYLIEILFEGLRNRDGAPA